MTSVEQVYSGLELKSATKSSILQGLRNLIRNKVDYNPNAFRTHLKEELKHRLEQLAALKAQ